MKLSIITIYLICINLFAFMFFGLDKLKAVKSWRRIPERRLIILAVIGGSLGSLLAMHLFHHKTKKNRFRLGVPIIFFTQLVFYFVIVLYK